MARTLAFALLGCASSPNMTSSSSPSPSSPSAKTTAPAAPPSAAPPVTPGSAAHAPESEPARQACGSLECLDFPTAKDAFAYAVRARPRVVGIGESHAQRGAPNVKSATRRFGEELLPVLSGSATDLVIELLTPNPKCKKEQTEAVVERSKPITESQAATNQNEFVALGFAAKKLGITPRALSPSCDEYQSVLDAGQSDVLRFLSLIAELTARDVSELLEKRPATATIVAYGGALHNDATPRPGRETLSYAPRLHQAAAGTYVEIDLIVPEFVRDEEPWRSLPWYGAFDHTRARQQASLIVLSPTSYVLIFPHTAPAEKTP